MPKYIYICDNCMSEKNIYMSISDFLKNKSIKIKCLECDSGVLFYRPSRISSKVDRDAIEIKEQIREDVINTVNKVKSGDSKAIRDIYGDRKNPYKQ